MVKSFTQLFFLNMCYNFYKKKYMKKRSGKVLFIIIFVLGFLTAFLFLARNDFLSSILADSAATSVEVSGAAPIITTAPSDGGVTSTNPVNVGSDVTFTTTASDANGENYYLAVCKTDAISANNSAAPTCTGGFWCYSASTVDDAEATCSTTTIDAWSETEDWYVFVCDHSASSACSSPGAEGTGDNGSPFHVNHAPPFSDAVNDGPKNPGETVTITATSNDDDNDHTADTVMLVVCKTQGVTGTACDGGGSDTWCTSSLAASDPDCGFTVPTPTVHGALSTYVYVFDSHDFASDGGTHNTAESPVINDIAPTVSSVALNSGSIIDISGGGEGVAGSTNITVTAEITDNNGCTDVTGVTTSAYTTAVGVGSCTEDDNNNCYYDVSCTGDSVCDSGITETYSCTVNFKYHADPTDTGTPDAAETWKNTVYALDGSAQGSTELSTGVELQSYLALDVTSAIDYGSLAIGEIADGTSLPQNVDIESTGNCGLDVEVSGTQLTSGANSITTSSQHYATTTAVYSAALVLQDSATEFELDLKKTTTTATLSNDLMYWGLQIPDGTLSGSYSGTNTFTAKKAETGDWE